MSIALIFELNTELRRLFIAGSELAAGDFRLLKLLPQIKKSGEKSPVFQRVADSLEKLLSPEVGKAAEHLLELSALTNAIVSTQGETGIVGDIREIDDLSVDLKTKTPLRKLKPVIDALTSKGSGRLEIIREAFQDGVFKDLRLVPALVAGLNDGYAEIADMAFEILKGYGAAISKVVEKSLNLDGGKGDGRKIELLSLINGEDMKNLYLEAVEKGSTDVKVSSIKAISGFPDCEDLILELSGDRKKDIREAALLALAGFNTEKAIERLKTVFTGKERELAAKALKVSKSSEISRFLLEKAEEKFPVVLKELKEKPSEVKKLQQPSDEEEYLNLILSCMYGKKEEGFLAFYKKCIEDIQKQFKGKTAGNLLETVAGNLLSYGTEESYIILESLLEDNKRLVGFSLESALKFETAERIFEKYKKYLENGKKSFEGSEIIRVMDAYADFEPQFAHDNYYSYYYRRDYYVKWDPRWVEQLYRLGETRLVARLASSDFPEGIRYLLSLLEKNSFIDSGYLDDIILGLIQAKYEGAAGAALKVIENGFSKKSYYTSYYVKRFISVLRNLPKESADEINEYAKSHEGEVADYLHELVFYLKSEN